VDVSWHAWLAVIGVIAVALAADLLLLHRHAHEVSVREAAVTSAAWILTGLGFGFIVWLAWGQTRAAEYFSGYLIEKSLSVDNIFIMASLLGYFAVAPRDRHRVLFWGVVGALLLRGLFIATGVPLLKTFHWAIYALGAGLILSGVRMATHHQAEMHPHENLVLRLLGRVVPCTPHHDGQKLFTRRAGRVMATPLFAALVAVEATDIIFATDSIPAIFSVTDEPFLIFTSNAFAILGMRALYFCLAGTVNRFRYLRQGLAIILAFVGTKMVLSTVIHVPTPVSLGVIAAVLTISIVASVRADRRQKSLASARTDVTVHAHARPESRLHLVVDHESDAEIERQGVGIRCHLETIHAAIDRDVGGINHQSPPNSPAHHVRVNKQVVDLEGAVDHRERQEADDVAPR
jgi:tellurite resistance protein TerC